MEMEMEIALEGRELVKNEILEHTAKTIVSVSEYNDGTIIEYRIEAGEVSVKCNKQLVLQEDGKTVKIID